MSSTKFWWRFFRQNFWIFAGSTALVIALGFFRTYGITFIGQLMNNLERGIVEGIWYFILMACLMQSAFYFLRWLVAAICQYLQQKCALSLRVELLRHLDKISFLQFEELGSGNLQSILRNDADMASRVIFAFFFRVLSSLFMALFSLGYLLLINWKTGVIALVLSILTGILTFKLNQPLKEYQVAAQAAQGQVSNHVSSVAQNFDTLKTYGAIEFLLHLYRRPREEYHRRERKVIQLNSYRENLVTLIMNISMFCGILLLSWGVAAGYSSVGDLVVLLTLVAHVITPVGILFHWVPVLVRGFAGWQRADQIFSLPTADPIPAAEVDDIEEVHLRNLRFSYPDGEPMEWDSLRFQKGKLYSIAGESGSGKSTLLKLLCGVYEASSGELRINGQPAPNSSLFGQIAYVPANPNLFSMSIYDNITMGQEQDRTVILEQLEELGLADWITSLPEGLDYSITENSSNVSGGQKQMLSIARALLSQKSILIMDEPFSAVDKEKEGFLLEVLETIKRQRIVIFTTHRNSTLRAGDEHILLE